MNTVLWIVQALLAFTFFMAGVAKVSRTRAELKAKGKGRMDWVDDVSPSQLKVIGTLEIAGAAGLIAPMATGVAPWLTYVAALGLALTMVGALALHAKRKDPKPVVAVNLVLLALALFVAWGRYA